MFISRHTLKWTKTCRSSGDFPHAHTAHFLLNRHTKSIIPLETGTKAIEPVPGSMRRKRAAELLGAGVGAVHDRVKAYRGGGVAALRPENRNSGQPKTPT